MSGYWREWWKAAGLRALRTFGQGVAAMVPAGVMITEVSWPVVLGTAALMAVLSLMRSLGGLPEVQAETEEVG